MSKPETVLQQPPVATEADPKPVAETRIDTAHLPIMQRDPPPEESVEGATSAESDARADEPSDELSSGKLLLQQIRDQAEQLGAYLRTRQEELDHREAQINARAAQIDHDARTARLWLSERDQELDRREEALAQREQEANARLERIATSDASLRKRADEAQQLWTERQRESRVREEALAQRERAIQEREEALLQGTQQLAEDRQRAEDALTFQRQQIDAHRVATEQLVRDLYAAVERRRAAVESEALQMESLAAAEPTAASSSQQTAPPLACGLEEVEPALRALEDQRRKLEEEIRGQRRTLVEEERRMTATLEYRRQAVERRDREIDESAAALHRLRQELKEIHRETLEDRLIAEQLWAGLAGAVPDSILQNARADARTRLANELRASREWIAEQRRELESLRSNLAAQSDRILKQKQRFEDWATRREQELAAAACS